YYSLFFFFCCSTYCYLHSFPTRRSSDLSLGLVYRFYGTMDWKKTEVPWEKAERSQKYFGKTFIGCDTRPSDLHGGNSTQNRRRSDRKSTRLNSSHLGISYAVFCLKKKRN